MTHTTADQHKADCIAKMGENLGAPFAGLWQEVAFLHSKWLEFVELFGTSEERINLLNEAAPTFFGHLQDILWEDMLIGLARLTDPPKSVGRPNLSIQAIPQHLNDDALRKQTSDLIQKAVDLTSFARDWRNRRIAHRDLTLAIDDHATPLESGSRASVREALAAIDTVMNAIEMHYLKSETKYDFPSLLGGAAMLLHTLYDGVREMKERETRIAKGEISDRDTPPNL